MKRKTVYILTIELFNAKQRFIIFDYDDLLSCIENMAFTSANITEHKESIIYLT